MISRVDDSPGEQLSEAFGPVAGVLGISEPYTFKNPIHKEVHLFQLLAHCQFLEEGVFGDFYSHPVVLLHRKGSGVRLRGWRS